MKGAISPEPHQIDYDLPDSVKNTSTQSLQYQMIDQQQDGLLLYVIFFVPIDFVCETECFFDQLLLTD